MQFLAYLGSWNCLQKNPYTPPQTNDTLSILHTATTSVYSTSCDDVTVSDMELHPARNYFQVAERETTCLKCMMLPLSPGVIH